MATTDPDSEPEPETDTEEIPIEDVRHVTPDRGPHCLVVGDDADEALCGQRVGGLRPAGDSVATLTDAAQLGAWVNARDDVCPDCREAFNDAVFPPRVGGDV